VFKLCELLYTTVSAQRFAHAHTHTHTHTYTYTHTHTILFATCTYVHLTSSLATIALPKFVQQPQMWKQPKLYCIIITQLTLYCLIKQTLRVQIFIYMELKLKFNNARVFKRHVSSTYTTGHSVLFLRLLSLELSTYLFHYFAFFLHY